MEVKTFAFHFCDNYIEKTCNPLISKNCLKYSRISSSAIIHVYTFTRIPLLKTRLCRLSKDGKTLSLARSKLLRSCQPTSNTGSAITGSDGEDQSLTYLKAPEKILIPFFGRDDILSCQIATLGLTNF